MLHITRDHHPFCCPPVKNGTLSRPHQDLSFPPRQCRLRQLLQQALLHAPMQHAAAHHQAIYYQAAGGEAAESTGHQAVVTKAYKRCWKSLENGSLTWGSPWNLGISHDLTIFSRGDWDN